MANSVLVGALELNKTLTNLQLDEASIKPIMEQACLMVENQARTNCPVDSGVLRNSITSRVEGYQGVVGTNVFYAVYVELGTGLHAKNGDGRKTPWHYMDDKGNWHYTVGQHPQPFLSTALEYQRDNVINLFKEKLEDNAKH